MQRVDSILQHPLHTEPIMECQQQQEKVESIRRWEVELVTRL